MVIIEDAYFQFCSAITSVKLRLLTITFAYITADSTSRADYNAAIISSQFI